MTRTQLSTSLAVAVSVLLGVPRTVWPQPTVLGHLFAGPTKLGDIGDRRSQTPLTVGGGVEVVLNTNIAVGVEIASLHFPTFHQNSRLDTTRPALWNTQLSINESIRFATTRRVEPFVTGGLTLDFGDIGMFIGGAGADVWLSRRLGIRAAARTTIRPVFFTPSVGVVFRRGS